MKRSIVVTSPSHKCAIDFKVRGRLPDRAVKTLATGELRVRVGNRWMPVFEIHEHAPLRMVVARDTVIPGLS